MTSHKVLVYLIDCPNQRDACVAREFFQQALDDQIIDFENVRFVAQGDMIKAIAIAYRNE